MAINYLKQFYQAAKTGNIDNLMEAIKSGENLNNILSVAFNEAVIGNHMDIVNYLLSHENLKENLDINADEGRALIWACSCVYIPMINCLITYEADVSINNYSAYKTLFMNISKMNNKDQLIEPIYEKLLTGLKEKLLYDEKLREDLFYWAKNHKDNKVINLIKSNKSYPEKYKKEQFNKEFEAVCIKNDEKRMNIMIKNSLFNIQHGLFIACKADNINFFTKLESMGADIDAKYTKEDNIMFFLLNNQANKNYQSYQKIGQVALDYSLDILLYLLMKLKNDEKLQYERNIMTNDNLLLNLSVHVNDIIKQCCSIKRKKIPHFALLDLLFESGILKENIMYEILHALDYYYEMRGATEESILYLNMILQYIKNKNIPLNIGQLNSLLRDAALHNDSLNLLALKELGADLKSLWSHYQDKKNWLSDSEFAKESEKMKSIGLYYLDINESNYHSKNRFSPEIELLITHNIKE